MLNQKPNRYTTETLAEVIRRLHPARPVRLLNSFSLQGGQCAQLSGGFGVAKTQILMDTAAGVLLPPAELESGTLVPGQGKPVVWIDLDAKFSILRFVHILNTKLNCCPAVSQRSDADRDRALTDALNRFYYVKPTVTSAQFLTVLDELALLDFEPRLIVIDSISAYLWLEAEESKKGSIYDKYAVRLRHLAKKYGCSIVMSFHVSLKKNATFPRSLAELVTCNVNLSRSNSGTKILARICDQIREVDVTATGIEITE